MEVGVKATPAPGVTTNLTLYHTGVKDFQAQVVNAGVGVLRGYLANAEKVRVRAPSSTPARASSGPDRLRRRRLHRRHLRLVPDAPPPLEDTGGPQVKDISGSGPARSLEVGDLRSAARISPAPTFFGRSGQLFGGVDTSYRSSPSSSASASRYLWCDGYPLLNARVGVRWSEGWAHLAWVTQRARPETTWSSSPPRRATPGCTWANPAMHGPWG